LAPLGTNYNEEIPKMRIKRLALSIMLAMMAWGLAAAQEDKPAAEDIVSGKYQGAAKSEALGEIPLTVEIKNEGGKLSGKIESPQGPLTITSGTYQDGRINLKFDVGGTEGTVTAQLKDGKIVGQWALAGQTGTLELKKVELAAAKPSEPKPAEIADPLSGEWDAVAEAQGMTIPFTLKLKLEGDKVSGEASSPQGTLPIANGTWVGEKLSFSLDTPNGAIKMTATVKENKLVGEYDLAGQIQGKWEASRKKQ
jgi:major membrane immunogen (membrane-anchored lipoprotein)